MLGIWEAIYLLGIWEAIHIYFKCARICEGVGVFEADDNAEPDAGAEQLRKQRSGATRDSTKWFAAPPPPAPRPVALTSSRIPPSCPVPHPTLPEPTFVASPSASSHSCP